MKIRGRKIEGPNVEILVLPRGEGEPLVFKAQAVLSFDKFNELCPKPAPPSIMLAGGERKEDLKDPIYVQRNEDYAKKHYAWMILKSLEATPDLEWETIDMGDPSTWLNFDKELEDSGLSSIEVGRIRQTVQIANCLSEERLEEARQSFLAGLQRQRELLLSQKDGTNGTPSGELANVSASALPASENAGTTATAGFSSAS